MMSATDAEISSTSGPAPVDISFVIVSWNVAELLRQCIDSIAAHASGHTYEIIVVDNHSSDATAAMLQNHYPWVKFTALSENVGFARANNIGFRFASGRYIFILNPDTLLEPGTISHLTAVLHSQPKVGMVGPRLIYPGGEVQVACARLLPTLSAVFFHDTLRTYQLPVVGKWFSKKFSAPYSFETSQPVEAISGAAMLVRREVITESVKGFGENFLHAGEDLDFCYRVRKSGWDIYYEAAAAVVHFGGSSSAQAPVRTVVNAALSQQEYFFRCYGRLQGWIYRAIIQYIDSPIIAITGVVKFLLHLETAQQLRNRLLSIRGIWAWKPVKN